MYRGHVIAHILETQLIFDERIKPPNVGTSTYGNYGLCVCVCVCVRMLGIYRFNWVPSFVQFSRRNNCFFILFWFPHTHTGADGSWGNLQLLLLRGSMTLSQHSSWKVCPICVPLGKWPPSHTTVHFSHGGPLDGLQWTQWLRGGPCQKRQGFLICSVFFCFFFLSLLSFVPINLLKYQ